VVVAVVVEAGVMVVAGVVGKVSGFSGTGYSYPVTGSSDGHNGTPASRNSEFLPNPISAPGMQSGIISVVVVVIVVVVVVVVVVVEVVVVVVVTGVVGNVSGFSGTGYSYPVTGSSDGHNGTPASRNSGFFPNPISASGIHSGMNSVVVVFVAVVVVVVVVVMVVLVVLVVAGVVGKVSGFSGTGYS